MYNKTLPKFILATYILVFIVLFLFILSLNTNYLNKISFVLILGFITIIIGFFLFITLEPNKENNRLFVFKVLSENLIKFILVISMIFAYFIPPITFTTTVMDWSQIGTYNYIRAIIFILGCAFLPGACAFNLMFPNSDLYEKFKVEPFFLKITFYPIFSFALIGISVLILDTIGLIREFFSIALFVIILSLFILDLTLQFLRDRNTLKNNFTKIIISKHTFYILIIAIGHSLFTIGVQIAVGYLIPGDAWVGLRSVNFIGNPDLSPTQDIKFRFYPSFWGYIIFGLGQLSGIPYINLNVLLTPFCYLAVTSMYLFVKAILSDFKEIYAVLATIFVSMFAGIFYLHYNELGLIIFSFGGNKPTSLRYALDYKNFAYILFNLSMGLFITCYKTRSQQKGKFSVTHEEFKIIFLSSLFLLTSYMIYMLPLIAGVYLPFLYCLFFEGKKKRKFHFFTIFLLLLFTLFIIFDILREFVLSFSFYVLMRGIGLNFLEGNDYFLVVYGILLVLIFFFTIFQIIYFKVFNSKKKRNFLKRKIKTKPIFLILLVIFTGLIVLEIYNILYPSYIYNFIYIQDNEWYYPVCNYLNHSFLSIGIIGIVGVYLSYFCFKKERNLFYFLISWIIFSFAITLILYVMVYNFFENISTGRENYDLTHFWFVRNWIYAIPALSILASIGVIDLEKKIHNIKFKNRTLNFKNQNFYLILKISIASILIFSSYSNIVIAGMEYNSDLKMDDAEAQVVGWITKEIPLDSNILGERSYNLEYLISVLSEKDDLYYNILYVFRGDKGSYESQIYKLKELNIQYAIFYDKNHLRLSSKVEDFIDNYLIPKIYYKTLYKYKGLVVYYAPDLEDDVCELMNCDDSPSFYIPQVRIYQASTNSNSDNCSEEKGYCYENTTIIYRNN